MASFFLVFLGGGLGSIARFALFKQWPTQKTIAAASIPMSTLIANIVGCMLLGGIMALSKDFKIPNSLFLLLAVGFCGGLTTFSTFIFELGHLQSQNSTYDAVVYFLLSILLGSAMTVLSYLATSKSLS